jgi:hypothetical protein
LVSRQQVLIANLIPLENSQRKEKQRNKEIAGSTESKRKARRMKSNFEEFKSRGK